MILIDNFVFTIALITINKLLQFFPLNALWGWTTFFCAIAIANFCMHYNYKQLLYGLMQQRTITCFRSISTSSVTLYTTTYIKSHLNFCCGNMCLDFAEKKKDMSDDSDLNIKMIASHNLD